MLLSLSPRPIVNLSDSWRECVVKSREIVNGSLFVIGILGFLSLLIAAGADLSSFDNAPWWSYMMPALVVWGFWPVCMSDRELHRQTRWPFIFRYPLETAGIILLLWLAYVIGARGVDRRSWGLLGGIAAALSVFFRGRIEAESRGEALDQRLGALSRHVLLRRWRSMNSISYRGRPPH